MTFSKKNYLMMLAAVGLLILGFVLLSGGAPENPVEEFSEDIYSFRRLWLAPIVLVGGFVLAGVAIFKRFED